MASDFKGLPDAERMRELLAASDLISGDADELKGVVRELAKALRDATALCARGHHHVPLETTKKDRAGNGIEHRCMVCGATRKWGYPFVGGSLALLAHAGLGGDDGKSE